MTNLCIHGHFYQPPRENPWTGEIEKQKSAAPFHDWNEKIWSECYEPNTHSQIINDDKVIVAEINNFDFLNFNFGPTLLHWLKRKHPETYKHIIDADARSVCEHNGHGNAIAMCYNHMIMPLANEHDKETQIKWALTDFKFHFGRESEGIWLPETACNENTLESLCRENISYTILDSSQALKISKFHSNISLDVSNGNINTLHPYRWFSKINSSKFIDIFFYNGPVSKAIAFNDALMSSENLLHKINEAIIRDYNKLHLVSVATDGETFGHHKKLGERTLAFFLKVLATQNNINIVNYGEYLQKDPPQFEVQIKPGEGTSWSCVHGVKRWADDCGCGGGDGWNQKWRKPLRDALNWLRDELIIIFETEGRKYFKNVWSARNDYILLLNDATSRKEFFQKKSCKKLSAKKELKAIELLEMQKYSMFMFTSCGWFFSEISGIETVKILEYASRAMELAKNICGAKLEKKFLSLLEKAPSNIKKYMNGKKIYEELVLSEKQIHV